MSRPFLPLALAFAAATLSLTGCKTSTPYTAMYSPRKTHYVPPPEKKEKSAEALLGPEAGAPGVGVPGLPGTTPPPAGLPETPGAIPPTVPGLPPPAAGVPGAPVF